jgi:serine/threonine protein phosphatase PrpC
MKVDTLTETGSSGINEDVLLVGRRVFGVFDGVTSLSPFRDPEGRTGGMIAATIASGVFGERTNAPLAELCEEANRRIAQAMANLGVDARRVEERWGTTAAVVRVGVTSFEWVLVGDSAILVVFADGTHQAVAPLEDHDQETRRLRAELHAHTLSQARVEMQDALRAVRARANIDYGVLDGQLSAMEHVRGGRMPLAGVRHLLLFTDGLLLPPVDPLGALDPGPIVERYLDGGLPAAQALVREVAEADPEGVRPPRLKARDDVAAIAITFPPPAQPPTVPGAPISVRQRPKRLVRGSKSAGAPSRRRRGR